MIITAHLKEGTLYEVSGNPVFTSLDGNVRAPLAVILEPSWSPEERANFGIYQIEVDPPQYQQFTGLFDGLTPLYEDQPYPTEQDVIAERRRRLGVGFDYDFGDERGVHRIGTNEDDMIGWDQVSKLSTAAILSGNPTASILIVTDTGPVTVTAAEWQSIVVFVGQAGQPIWQASFVLQSMDPIPRDYDDDVWW